MRKFVTIAAGLGVLTSLSACARHGNGGHVRPDEFAVARAAPLVIPPDFSLVPPAPGLWAEWVASKQTGTPKDRMISSPGMSTTSML